ncbi:GPP34 family phosphoprotein [Pseudonocardia sp. C8]|uniref:GOLPH3/VPS74 family protein n=1 Tax=Pseudonocardia sp. C8 TaxID=2762759 RepID=UPI001642473F|nr:GPP34 family phosphoprotein [Pseudonocardia sp. C8]MBC3193039.1 GPP34 family phosphoprotein [Pseudonocardia sp. C8]
MEQGALANGLFLIAYDEAAGRSGLAPDLLACGLVGAQLADLVTAGALTIDPDHRVVATRSAPAGAAAGEAATLVMDSVAHEPRAHPVRSWIDALGGLLLEVVQNDLVQRGVLRQASERTLLGRRRTKLAVADSAAVHAPGIALRGMVRHPGTFTLQGAVTLVVIAALGVEQVLEPEVDRATARRLAQDAADHLPEAIARLRAGLAETAAAVSVAVRR